MLKHAINYVSIVYCIAIIRKWVIIIIKRIYTTNLKPGVWEVKDLDDLTIRETKYTEDKLDIIKDMLNQIMAWQRLHDEMIEDRKYDVETDVLKNAVS